MSKAKCPYCGSDPPMDQKPHPHRNKEGQIQTLKIIYQIVVILGFVLPKVLTWVH